MTAIAAGDIAKVHDPASLQGWLAALDADEDERLTVLDRLWANLEQSRSPPDLVLEILEQARVAHVGDVQAMLKEAAVASFPLPAPNWSRLQRTVASLRRARDLYKDTHTRLVEDTGVSTRMVIPGTAGSVQAILPLARALDYQVRVLQALLLNRVRVEASDWAELCLLGRHLRASTYMDAVLPDPSPLLRACTARALFVYPLLLAAAELDRFGDAAIAFVDRIARQWSVKAGFRIDEDGRLHENRHGPTLALTGQQAVRLDTQRLVARLRERAELFAEAAPGNAPRLPRGLSPEQARQVFDTLLVAWSDGFRPHRLEPKPHQRSSVRFGPSSARAAARAPVAGGDTPPAVGLASKAYMYGRFEQNTVIRMALGASSSPGDAIGELMAHGDPVQIQAAGGLLVQFERRADTPVALDTLAAWTEGTPDAPVLRLGRVVRIGESALDEPGAPRAHRVTVSAWPMPAQLVGLRMADNPFYDDAYFLPAGVRAGDTDSLFVPPGHWRAGASAMLRLPKRDVRIHFESLMERGAGFERVQVRLTVF